MCDTVLRALERARPTTCAERERKATRYVVPTNQEERITRLTLIRTGRLAAIAGGLLRAASSFAPVAIGSGFARESLYILVDVCLTVGLSGFYVQRSKSLGWPGAAGLAIALGGIATIRANRAISTVDLYPVGALAT